MKQGVRLLVVLCAVIFLLALAPLMVSIVATGATTVYAAPMVAADDTPTSTPADTPTPIPASNITTNSPSGSSDQIVAATPSMTGIIIATTLTCIMGIAGLVITYMTLTRLLRGGYGPFLRAMVFGSKGTGASDAASTDDGGIWDASHTLNYRPGSGERSNSRRSNDARDEYDEYQEGAPRRRSGGSRSERGRGGSGRRSSSRRDN